MFLFGVKMLVCGAKKGCKKLMSVCGGSCAVRRQLNHQKLMEKHKRLRDAEGGLTAEQRKQARAEQKAEEMRDHYSRVREAHHAAFGPRSDPRIDRSGELRPGVKGLAPCADFSATESSSVSAALIVCAQHGSRGTEARGRCRPRESTRCAVILVGWTSAWHETTGEFEAANAVCANNCICLDNDGHYLLHVSTYLRRYKHVPK